MSTFIVTTENPDKAYVLEKTQYLFVTNGIKVLATSMAFGKDSVISNITSGQIFSNSKDGAGVFKDLFTTTTLLYLDSIVAYRCVVEGDVLSNELKEAGKALLKFLIGGIANQILSKTKTDNGELISGFAISGFAAALPDYLMTWTNKSDQTIKLFECEVKSSSQLSLIGEKYKSGYELTPGKTVTLSWMVDFAEGMGSTFGYMRWWSKKATPCMPGSGMTFGVKIAQDPGFTCAAPNAPYTMTYVGSPTGAPDAWTPAPVKGLKDYSFTVEGEPHGYKITVDPTIGGAWRSSVGITIQNPMC